MLDGESRVTGSFVVGDGVDQTLEELFQDRFCSKGRSSPKGWRRWGMEEGGGEGGLEKATGEEEGEDILERQFQRGVSLQGWRVLEDAKKRGRPSCHGKVSPRTVRELARSERFDKNDSFIIANSAASVAGRVMRAFRFEFNHSVLREQTAVCL